VISTVEPERCRRLNAAPARGGEYVLYWMQSSHRSEENPALRYAVERADRARLPVVAYFGLWPSYPGGNLRHLTFLLEGLADAARSLEDLGIRSVIRIERPDSGVLALAKNASSVVVDRGYLRLPRAWCGTVAGECRCPLVQVEANVVVPVETASPKEEYSAATFRPKVSRLLDRFLRPVQTTPPERSSLDLDLSTLAGISPGAILSRVEINRSVTPSPVFAGGTSEANRRFGAFLENGLDGFTRRRSDPGEDGGSGMSPYLHYGQISPVTLAVLAREHGGEGAAGFLEELVVRRELAANFVHYNDHYDGFPCLPAWAQRTLGLHRDDPREFLYTRDEFERAGTHDPYWNAAQRQVVHAGMMQGYMRMYWGKKVMEWSASPEEGYATALFLNDRYGLDGRDPSGYAGVAWCFGKHDRPWRERGIYGTVRSMTARGLERKFTMDRYLERVRRLSAGAPGSPA